jgi:hypothetical protein
MGIVVEFNPDLTLRNKPAIKKYCRKLEECIPSPLIAGKIYEFLKKEQRFYWLHNELPFLETQGKGELSSSMASITHLELIHFKISGDVMTKGKNKVIKVLSEGEIYFNGINKIKNCF